MVLERDDMILLVKLFQEFSVFPKGITNDLKCSMRLRPQEIGHIQKTYNYNVSLEYGRMQTFFLVETIPFKSTVKDIQLQYQNKFNDTVRSLLYEHEPTQEKYPEYTI